MSKVDLCVPKVRFQYFVDKWQCHKIISVADYVDYRGKTPPKTISGILLVTAKNIKQGFIDYEISKEFISPLDFDEVMRRGKVKIGDVLITTEAPLGNVASVDNEEIALAQRVIKYRGKDEILNNTFLKYRFLTESFQKLLEKNASGGTVQGIKGSILHELSIKITNNIQEQTQIGSFFQKIDQVIELQKKTLAIAQDYKKAMLQKMFPQQGEKIPQIRFAGFSGDWEEGKLSNLGYISVGGDINKDLLSTNAIYPVIANGMKLDGVVGYYATYKINAPAITISGRGDIGFAKARFENFTPIVRLIVFKPLNGDVCFFENTINQIKFSVESTGVPQLTAPQFGSYKVLYTTFSEQQKIGAFFQKLDQQIAQYEKKLETYQNLKKAMLQRMFV